MIVCPTCRAQHMNGTLFCEECGADLQVPAASTFGLDTVATASALKQPRSPFETLPASEMPPIPRPPTSAPPPVSRPAFSARRDLELVVLNSGRKVPVPAGKETVIIGRSDSLTGEAPDIDLINDNAIELGVSRRHACITIRDTTPFLTDLGSTNRTFLNRTALMRGQPYPLKDGDEVRLGNAILRIVHRPIAR